VEKECPLEKSARNSVSEQNLPEALDDAQATKGRGIALRMKRFLNPARLGFHKITMAFGAMMPNHPIDPTPCSELH
jgi:hypothetical protein